MKNKLITLLLCVAVSCTLLGGCQSSSGSTPNNSTSSSSSSVETDAKTSDSTQSERTQDDNAITGQVTAIDGNTITLALGERAARPDGDFTPPENGKKPTDDNGSDTLQTGDSQETGVTGDDAGTPPTGDSGGTPPSGDSGGTPPSGDNGGTPPSGNGGGPRGLTLTGEEKTITIDDSTTITKDSMGQSSEASIDDITEGSVLTLVMDGDTVVSITISDFGGGNGGGPGGNMNGGTEEAPDLNGSKTIDSTEETLDGDTVSSTTADENTILIENGGSLTLDDGGAVTRLT